MQGTRAGRKPLRPALTLASEAESDPLISAFRKPVSHVPSRKAWGFVQKSLADSRLRAPPEGARRRMPAGAADPKDRSSVCVQRARSALPTPPAVTPSNRPASPSAPSSASSRSPVWPPCRLGLLRIQPDSRCDHRRRDARRDGARRIGARDRRLRPTRPSRMPAPRSPPPRPSPPISRHPVSTSASRPRRSTRSTLREHIESLSATDTLPLLFLPGMSR